MKLLFDENVSPKLTGLLGDEYPGSVHVRDAGFQGAADRLIWDHARDQGYVIVSKDDDFRQRSSGVSSKGRHPRSSGFSSATQARLQLRNFSGAKQPGFERSRARMSRPS